MRRALELARRGRGFTHPNPMVGAVIVRDDAVVAEGWHRACGGPHAEVEALRVAGPAARGATMYVSLEPCAHHGRTPPCTDAVRAAGIARLVFAAADPNPRARGGADTLRAAGLDVTGGVEQEAASQLNAIFFGLHERGAPFISLKLALSLDGRIAAAPGVRTAITGPEAQYEAHRLRADHEAVMVGGRTALVDDPLLTVRHGGCRVQPARVVLSGRAGLSVDSALVRGARDIPVWLVCAEDAPAARLESLAAAGVHVVRAARGVDGRLELRGVRAALAAAGLRSVLLEGGAETAAGFLDAGLVDRMHLLLAPTLLGSGGVAGLVPAQPSGWERVEVRALGSDTMITLQPARGPAERC